MRFEPIVMMAMATKLGRGGWKSELQLRKDFLVARITVVEPSIKELISQNELAIQKGNEKVAREIWRANAIPLN